MLSSQEYLVPQAVAQLMNVSLSQVYAWINNHELTADLVVNGHHRFQLNEIKVFAKTKQIELVKQNNKQRLLIVDDEPLYADFLKDALSESCNELDIDVCFNGFAAGLKMNSFKPTVVLVDIMMPAVDGLQFCQQIKQDPLLNHTRVIVMSGAIDDDMKERLTKEGAEAYFEKPINMNKLMKQLNF
ncbi:MAG: response regulator [Colwellia sp.]|nr:response regulator [Colwellia sp.]